MSPKSSLLTLAEQLLRCADQALLDSPLDALKSRVDDDETRELLRDLYEAGEAKSLRELLEPKSLERWAFEAATPREGQALRAQLRRWLGFGGIGADDPARLSVVSPLPNDVDAILAWARPYGLLGELSRPANEVMLDSAALPPGTTLLECALGLFEPSRGASLLAKQRLESQARAHLSRDAAEHAAKSARQALWKRPLPEGQLRTLSERLRGLLGGANLAELHAMRFVPARLVTIDDETGIARAELIGPSDTTVTARLFLAGYEQRALEGECALCKAAPCLHVRTLAARVLDACFDETDRLHGHVFTFAEIPSWKRFLRALSLDETTPASTSERLCFRLRVHGEKVTVGVMHQRALSHGRWSPGKLESAQKLMRKPIVTERDRPILEAMTHASRVLSAQFVPADLTLLRSLVEHPYVELEGRDEPLRIHEQSVEVALVEQPGGLLPKVSLSGVPLPPGVRARDASYVLRLDRASSTLVFATLTPSLRRLLAALVSFRGVLPPASYPMLSPWLASLQKVARVTAPKSLRGMERPVPKRLLMRITPSFDEGIDVALTVRALPMSPLWPPGQGPELCHGLEDGVPVFSRRDLSLERETATRVIESLALSKHPRLEPFAYRIEGTQAALTVLSDAARLVDNIEIEWAERGRTFAVSQSVRASDLKVGLFKKGNWFAIEGGVHNPAADIAIGRLLDAARRGERFVKIDGHDYAEIERDLFERLELAQLCVNENVREPLMSSAAVRFWLDELGAQTSSGDETTNAWLERARRDDVPLAPLEIRAELREYQRDGVAWLVDRSRFAPGVCLADEMGLGKTVQAIALLELRAKLGPALVIAPTSVVENWCSELERFSPKLAVRVYRGAERERHLVALGAGDVLVTSYELLLRDVERFAGLSFGTQIIDEAQMVKNARTLRAKAVAAIEADFRVALSGTPVENRLGDLWSLFHLIAPGLLGSWPRFRSRFAVPIERYERADRAAALRKLVAPFILRRTKRDVAKELPSRTELVHLVELSQVEQDLYDAAVRQARRAIGKRKRDDTARTVQILAELTRLRQLACHPRLVIEDEKIESSKLDALLELLDDVLPRGHRVLIFSQFTRHLALVMQALDARALTYLYLDGATPASKRGGLVERFQGGEGQLFLISLKAGGTGLNLTSADYVVHLDPWWNPAAEDQASDRAHRIGQEKPLTIVKLVAQNTIEEKVLGLHGQKRKLAESVLEGTDTATALDTTALEALLALA